MSNYFGYIRVSTTKQGEGVSLIEQKSAIERYAAQRGLSICRWFEELVTAGKKGRPAFDLMMKELRTGKAVGVLFHKIDRGTRNLDDWVKIGELIDAGIHVDFVSDPMDLKSRGGRLSADIMAVVAADFIRNNREEARKGCYGRLKQGLYPLPAPIGYLNMGKGKVKEIDPIQAPLVKMVFELYDSGTSTIEELVPKMDKLGLRNKRGGKVTRSGISYILNNPFYLGIMRLRNGQSFPGLHKQIVSSTLFKRVEDRLAGKVRVKSWKFNFPFRRMITCKKCKYSLIAEKQKNFVYYRCHSKSCPGISIREDDIDNAFRGLLTNICLPESVILYLEKRLRESQCEIAAKNVNLRNSIKLQLAQARDRTARLVDGYLDQVIDKSLFGSKKEDLLKEEIAFSEQLEKLSSEERDFTAEAAQIIELAKTALLSYEKANQEERRELLKIITSNCEADEKNLLFKPSLPFSFFKDWSKNQNCAPLRARPRTLEPLFQQFWGWVTRSKENDSTSKQ
jgi:site-specific DNA recombinase